MTFGWSKGFTYEWKNGVGYDQLLRVDIFIYIDTYIQGSLSRLCINLSQFNK